MSDYIETGTDGSALSLMDVVSEDEDLFSRIEAGEDIQRLRCYLKMVLDDREREVLILRYGLNGKEPLPQREVALHCGVSRSYVSRIETKALHKLKQAYLQDMPVEKTMNQKTASP